MVISRLSISLLFKEQIFDETEKKQKRSKQPRVFLCISFL